MAEQIKDRKLRMLLVDSTPFREELEEILKALNEKIKITTANNTSEAVMKLGCYSFDILLCHIRDDDERVAKFAKTRDDNILTICYSSGRVTDYIEWPSSVKLYYDEISEFSSLSIYTPDEKITNLLEHRGLI